MTIDDQIKWVEVQLKYCKLRAESNFSNWDKSIDANEAILSTLKQVKAENETKKP